MSRIAQRALILLVCLLACASLIATRPLPQPAVVTLPPPNLVPSLLPSAHAAIADSVRLAASRAVAEVRSAILLPEEADMPELRPPRIPNPAPPRVPGDGPWMRGTLVAQTERLDIYVGLQTFTPEQIAAIAPQVEQALRENEARLGTRLKYRVSIAFYRPSMAPQRGVRGMAFTDEARAEVYYAPDERLDRALTVAAHELGHHLEMQRYGQAIQRRADTILHEGLATWISGVRWLQKCSAPSWKTRAQQLQRAGIPLRLLDAEAYGSDHAYELWASFVDFLVQHYGWDVVDQLYSSGSGRRPGSADYQRVLGKSLDQLAEEWRQWVKS